MAKLPMKHITVIGMNSGRKAILDALQRLGAIEVHPFEEDGFTHPDIGSAQNVFSKNARLAENALAILNAVSPEKTSLFSSLEGRRIIGADEYYRFVDDADEIMHVADDCQELDRENAELAAELVRIDTQLDALSPWLSLDVPLGFYGTKRTRAFAGSFPEELTLEDISSRFAAGDNAPPIHVEIISRTKIQTCVFIICAASEADAAEEQLRKMGFARPAAAVNGNPAEKAEQLRASAQKCRDRIEKNKQEIASYSGMRGSWKFMYDYYTMRAEKYHVLEGLGEKKRSFVVVGYIPERDISQLSAIMEHKYGAAVFTSDVDKDEEDVPVLLQNNSFVAAVEPVVESYSLPGKNECDPSGIMSIFYYILFGLMLSDAAYGAIMTIGCAACLKKFKNMEDGMRKTLTMFMYCGISTFFWGIMFGGFFGDAIGVIAKTFFDSDIAFDPVWFSPLEDPMKMLFFSFGLGIIHLFTGLGVALYQKIKNGRLSDGICDVVFWYLIIGGLILAVCMQPMFTDMSGIELNLPPVFSSIALATAGVGALGIILTAGRPTKSPVKRILKGLYELYNITGYLSDILSYSRLLALGLATGVIASVFNQMGSMAGSGVLGIIIFVFAFVVGHILNILINILGAYVHTNRLQYVEFFGKFYEGGGRKFTPFAVNTKYFKIKEDISNGN